MNEKLQSVLGDDGMSELRALLNAANAAPLVPWKAWLLGAVKSWTNWFGVLLLGLPDLLPLISPQLEQMLDANAYKRIMQIAGLIVIILRFKTNKSVLEKGTTP